MKDLPEPKELVEGSYSLNYPTHLHIQEITSMVSTEFISDKRFRHTS